MKKVLSLSIIFCSVLVLFACTGTPLTPETDRQFLTAPEAFRWQDCVSGFLETPWGEYQNVSDMEKDLVYFSPAGEHTFYVLCGKPDCAHNDENCNAYGALALGYYNEHLYFVRSSDKGTHVLARMNMDGTEHTDIAELPVGINKITGASVSGGEYRFHNGQLIIVSVIPEGFGEYIRPMYKIDLDTGSAKSLFDDFLSEYIVCGYKAFGDTLYMDCEKKDAASETQNHVLAAGDLQTEEIRILFEDWPAYGGIPPVEKDGVLYYHLPGKGYYEYDLSGGAEELKLSADLYLSQTSYANQYLFARELSSADIGENEYVSNLLPWRFCVYDYGYNLVDTLSFEGFVYKPNLLFVTNDALYFSAGGGNKITHYAEIGKIGTGDFRLIPIGTSWSSR